MAQVYFHHASPGGCCDCGDLEAWKQSGCCTVHAGIDMDVDPRDDLPAGMRAVGEVVIDEAIALIIRTSLWAVQCFNYSEVNSRRSHAGPHRCRDGDWNCVVV